MNNDSHDFEQFMKRREDAARAFVRSAARFWVVDILLSAPIVREREIQVRAMEL